MKRRSFIQVAFSFLLPLGFLGKKEEPHYLFEWNGPNSPCTDDPAWQDKMEYGWHNHTSCDGVEYKYVTRHLNGPKGWIEYSVRGPNNEALVDRLGQKMLVNKVYGNVKFWVDYETKAV